MGNLVIIRICDAGVTVLSAVNYFVNSFVNSCGDVYLASLQCWVSEVIQVLNLPWYILCVSDAALQNLNTNSFGVFNLFLVFSFVLLKRTMCEKSMLWGHVACCKAYRQWEDFHNASILTNELTGNSEF